MSVGVSEYVEGVNVSWCRVSVCVHDGMCGVCLCAGLCVCLCGFMCGFVYVYVDECGFMCGFVCVCVDFQMVPLVIQCVLRYMGPMGEQFVQVVF